MARTRNAAKRQKAAAVESALFDPDVVFLLAGLLDARDLCRVSQTCQTLGGKQTAYNGLSMVEEAARRLLECATDWEKSCLPKYDGEGWVELCHHLLMLRSKLTFDQLVGSNIEYGDDQSIVRASTASWSSSTALCSNHVMRSGRHFSVFTPAGIARIGVTRPVRQIGVSATGLFDFFDPGVETFWEYLMRKRTDRWNDSNVHYCAMASVLPRAHVHLAHVPPPPLQRLAEIAPPLFGREPRIPRPYPVCLGCHIRPAPEERLAQVMTLSTDGKSERRNQVPRP